MSRIGKEPVLIPQAVEIKIDGVRITVKGVKGILERIIHPDLSVSLEKGVLILTRPTSQKKHKALHGLYRVLINNMVIGVSRGFKKQLEFVGVGYKASHSGQVLELSLGYSHNIFMEIPPEIKVSTETKKGKNPTVTLESNDKELIGEVAAKIRTLRKIEPYKGKGIKFVGEQIRRKAGKTATK